MTTHLYKPADITVTYTYERLESQKDRNYSLPNHGHYPNIVSTFHEYVIETTIKLVQENGKLKTNTFTLEKEQEHSREATAARKAAILVASLILLFIAGGSSMALGVIYLDLIRVLDAPHSEAALVQSIFMGTLIGGGVLFTGVLQKKGTGLPVMIASLLAGIAFFVSSFARTVPALIVLIGAVSGLSMGINYLSAFVTVGWTFRENKKTALALVTFGWPFGQISFPYVSQFLVSVYRWDGSLLLISGFILNGIPCGLIIYTSRSYFLVIKPQSTTVKDIVSDCFKDYLFVLFLFVEFSFSSLGLVEMWFVDDVAVVRGFDRDTGAVLLSLLGISGLIGRIIVIILLKTFQKTESTFHTIYAIILWGVAHFLVGYFHELWGITFGVVLKGLATGITLAVLPGSQIELRGIERYPQTVAICNLLRGAGSLVGGLLGGVTVDLTGGYEFIFTLAALVFFVCGILMAIVWLISKRRKQMEASAVIEYNKVKEENLTDRKPLLSK